MPNILLIGPPDFQTLLRHYLESITFELEYLAYVEFEKTANSKDFTEEIGKNKTFDFFKEFSGFKQVHKAVKQLGNCSLVKP